MNKFINQFMNIKYIKNFGYANYKNILLYFFIFNKVVFFFLKKKKKKERER